MQPYARAAGQFILLFAQPLSRIRRMTPEQVAQQDDGTVTVSFDTIPSDARKAAMFQLAAEIPTPILAELLGLSPTTATRWDALAARDWSQYTALRRPQPATRDT
jgi:hypothetical protein